MYIWIYSQWTLPVNTKHLHNICAMSDQRRRRWADAVQMLYKCFVFAGLGTPTLKQLRWYDNEYNILCVCYTMSYFYCECLLAVNSNIHHFPKQSRDLQNCNYPPCRWKSSIVWVWAYHVSTIREPSIIHHLLWTLQQLYSGSQSHTTRRGRASCSLWYAPVANVCDLLLFSDENRVIPEFRHLWKVTSPDEELFTVLYFPSDAFPMTWPRKLFTGLNSTGMMVTWLRTLAITRP